jgi:hypothetical protein
MAAIIIFIGAHPEFAAGNNKVKSLVYAGSLTL